MADAREIMSRSRSLRDNRRVWESHWQEVCEYMLPKRADFTTMRTQGDRRQSNVFDGVAQQQAIRLASTLDSLIKPRQSRWVSIRAEDDELNDDDEVRAWIGAANDIMWRHIYRPSARFQQSSAECDLDLVVIGTGCLMVRESADRSGVVFNAMHLRDVLIAEDHDGAIDTVFISTNMTARQIAQRFGREKMGKKSAKALADNRLDEQIPMLNAIYPREDYDAGAARADRKRFASVWVEGGGDEPGTVVHESGFDEFPMAIPRWDTAAGEVYGRGPGMVALPDVLTLNQMSKTILQAAHMAVDPPLLVPDDSIIGSVKTFPGGITHYDANLMIQAGRSPVFPLVTGTRLDIGLEMEQQRRAQIERAFFRDVMNLPQDNPQMTATEVAERRAEFVRIVGPAFGRLEADYLAPLAERTFSILLRQGRFPTPPRALSGREVRFEFASPVVKHQRSAEAAGGLAALERLAGIMQINPDIVDNLDLDAVARDVASSDMPPRWLRGLDAVAAIRAEKDAAREEQAMMDQLEKGAGIAKDALPALEALA